MMSGALTHESDRVHLKFLLQLSQALPLEVIIGLHSLVVLTLRDFNVVPSMLLLLGVYHPQGASTLFSSK